MRSQSVVLLLYDGRVTDLYIRGIESFYDSDCADKSENVILGEEQ